MYKHPTARPDWRQKTIIRRTIRDFFAGLLLFLAIFALATFDKHAAHSATVLTASEDLPAGWAYEIAVTAADRTKHANTVTPAGKMIQLALNNTYKAPQVHATPGLAEPSSRGWTLVVMALIFAVMTALTLGLWRHLRNAVVGWRDGRRV